jgi:hypothetical protein
MSKNFTSMPPKLMPQGLYEISATQKLPLGTPWELTDGRKFIYAKNGAVALVAGVGVAAEVPAGNHDEIVLTAASAGQKYVVGTLGATAAAENLYAEGYVRLNKGTLLGYNFKIKNHAAVLSAGVITAYLYDELPIAITDEEGSFIKHPCKDVVIHPSPPVSALVGVTIGAVTANYYCWLQVKGPAAVVCEGTMVIGRGIKPSATTDGNFTVKAEADTDEFICGQVIQVGVTTEVSHVLLDIPGW